MSDSKSGNDYMKDDLGELIGQLRLDDEQKRYLKSRWLDQVLWMEGKAKRTQVRYYALRMTAIVGGVIVPALIGLNLSGTYDFYVRSAAFVLGLMVAISVAVEEFFHYGERWRHYRSTVEILKSEGWQFFQLSGRYAQHTSHGEAYRGFADQVEQILNAEVAKFITEVVVEKKGDDAGKVVEDEPAEYTDAETDETVDDYSDADAQVDSESGDEMALETDVDAGSEIDPEAETAAEADAEIDETGAAPDNDSSVATGTGG